MTWINWDIFTKGWLRRAERRTEYIDDGDRFISLWIAFNGWMRGRFGEDPFDMVLIDNVKKLVDFKNVFDDLRSKNPDFARALRQLSNYTVANMRHINDASRIVAYDGTFESLIEVIYRVRCNLFHGSKDINENKKDIELVSLSYKILLPLFKEYLKTSHLT